MSIETTGTPKISIVTICRNSADTLERALRSVAGQTYRNFGMHTDRWGVDRRNDGDRREVPSLVCGSQQRTGQGNCRCVQQGIAGGVGDLVGHPANSDDWYASPDVLKAVADRYAGQDVVICGSIASCGVDGRLLKRYDSKPDKLRYGMYVPHPASFVPGALIARVGQFNPNLANRNGLVFCRLQLSGAKFQVIPMILTNMQLGGASSDWRRSLAEDFAIKRNFFGIDVRILVNHWLHAIILGVKATLAGRSR